MSRLKQDGMAKHLSRETIFLGANEDGEIFIFPVQLTTSRIGNLTLLIHTLLYMMTMHTRLSLFIAHYKHTRAVMGGRKRRG